MRRVVDAQACNNPGVDMADSLKCCVCGEPANPKNVLAGRAFCDRHFAQVNKHHMGFWRAGALQIVSMGIFGIVVALIADSLHDLSQTALIFFGVFLAIVPTIWWMVFFYREDQIEPEPKTRVLEVFALALILTDTVGLRVVNDVFNVRDWSNTNATVSLLAAILLNGFVYMAIQYFAVRAVVFTTEEFDERMDGIVYGTAAGLGVATLLNLHHIIDNSGVALAPGVIHVVTTALAQASFGGLMGYFMAQSKFEHRPMWWVPVGLSAAAVLNGLFTWLISEVSVTGLTVDPWRSLVLGVVVALATFVVLVALIRRANRLALSPSAG
jgi:RsiW-degrading membrane proteinase PrsW (M82 family)